MRSCLDFLKFKILLDSLALLEFLIEENHPNDSINQLESWIAWRLSYFFEKFDQAHFTS